MSDGGGRRIAAVALIAVVLVTLGVANDRVERPAPLHGGIDASAALPAAGAPGALSSSFYCAGGAADGSALDTTLVLANAGDTAADATITVFAGAVENRTDQAGADAVVAAAALPPVSTAAAIPARSRIEVRLGAVRASPFAGALVEIGAGQVSVERRVTGKLGLSAGPCASATSASWYLPTGATTIDAHEYLALLNPRSDDAVADLAFVTSDGFRAPPATQGMVLPARHLAIIDVGIAAGRHEQVATQVTTRRGRVVVDRMQTFDGSGSMPASSLIELGASTTSTVWGFPSGFVADTVGEVIAVYNPGAEQATVDVAVLLDHPEVNGTTDPIPVIVPAASYVLVSIANENRVPKALGHSVVVRVREGPPVAAERVMVGTAGRIGYTASPGIALAARSWILADGVSSADTLELVTLLNPSSTTARVDVLQLSGGSPSPIDGLTGAEVPPGGRLEVQLAMRSAGLALIVRADHPVLVERGILALSGPGLSLAPAVVLDGVATIDPSLAAPTTTTTVALDASGR